MVFSPFTDGGHPNILIAFPPEVWISVMNVPQRDPNRKRSHRLSRTKTRSLSNSSKNRSTQKLTLQQYNYLNKNWNRSKRISETFGMNELKY